ncbi:hypothetical protein BH10PLA1_BH10PLA1_14090 [soil metagenome]
MPQPPTTRGPSIWPTLAFLVGFVFLLIFISDYYLLPAFDAFFHAAPQDRALLSAHSALLLTVILLILACGLLLTFRIGRFFFPKPMQKRSQTTYIDAWAEAGKRTPPTT